jgi:hypothetical protein
MKPPILITLSCFENIGEKIVVPSEDMKDPYKPSKLKSKKKLPGEDLPSALQLSSLENLIIPPKDELYIPPVDKIMPDIVFAAGWSYLSSSLFV